MQTLLKKFLFTKQILVSEGNAYTEAADVFNAIFAFANLLNIKIVSGRKLATLELLKFAQEELGVDVPEPFYRGFPSSVRKLTPDQLLLDQLVHYALTYGLNDFDGPAGHSIFEGDFERAAFKESKTPVKEFRILTEEAAISELERLVADALASSRPLSATVMEVVTAFVTDYQTTIPACASKDTAARLWLATSSVEFAKFLQLSDVVKVVELVNFETYHSRKIKKLNFANRDRKRIAQLLDTIFARGDVSEKELRECYEKKAIWQGILHHIHYRPRTKQGTEFVALMRGKDNKSAYSEFEGLMSQGKITEAADSLIQSKGVGAFARNFDYIVSRLSDLNELPRLVAKLRSTSLIMQLQLLYHNLDYLSGECQRRVFTFTKFNLLSAHTETDAELLKRKTYLTRGMRQSIVYALYNALRDELKNKLGRVYVDPDAPKVAPPIQETTAASGLGVLPCGTRLPIMRGKKIRAFTYWEKVDDIDISMFGLDADGNQSEFSWRTMYYDMQSDAIVFSGDETRGYYGGSEYFDVDLDAIRATYPKMKWLIFCDNVFSGSPFSECFCKAGFMYRDILDSGAVYEPKTVQTSFLIDGDTTFKYMFAIDLETNEFVWLNIARDSSSRVAGANSMSFLIKYIERAKKVTLNDMLKLAATELVDDSAQAEIVFTDKPIALIDQAPCADEKGALRVKRDAVVLRPFDTERYIAFINGKFDTIMHAPRAEAFIESR